MKGKILLLVGLSVGYVLGARAGRGRYEDIKASANRIWSDPRVQKPVKQAEEFVKDKAPEVAEFVTDGVKKVVSQVASKPKPATKKPAARTASTASKTSSTTK